MTQYLEQLIDISVALGKGFYSVGEDFVYGIERTAEGLGSNGWRRVEEIGFEDEQIVLLLIEALKYPLEEKGPLYKAIKIILLEYYSQFPEETLKIIAKKGSVGVGYLAGRLLIGAKLAKAIAKRILLKIAASEGFKHLSVKLGVGAVATASGVGAVIGLLMLQGAVQRSSKSAKRLEKSHPFISKKLKENGGLDMIFFLIEGPMEKHLKAIKKATMSPWQFEKTANKTYVHQN